MPFALAWEPEHGKALRALLPRDVTKALFSLADLLQLAGLETRPARFLGQILPRGELTRGMSVIDVRWSTSARPNVELAVGVDLQTVRQYVQRTLSQT